MPLTSVLAMYTGLRTTARSLSGTFVPYPFLSPTAIFDHGSINSATERAGRSSLSVERGNRRPEPCEGDLQRHTSQGRLRLRWHPPRHGQSKFRSIHVGRSLDNWAQDSMANRMDFVELGLACADVCKALDRGMDGRQANQFSRSVFEAIEQLST